MGCSDSKNAGLPVSNVVDENISHEEREKRQNKNDGTEEFFTLEEALVYARKELWIPEDLAEQMVQRLMNEEDEQVSKQELSQLWQAVNEAKEALECKFIAHDPVQHGAVTRAVAVQVLQSYFKDVDEDQLQKMAMRYTPQNNSSVEYSQIIEFYSRLKARYECLIDKLSTKSTLSPDDVKQLFVKECMFNDNMADSILQDFNLSNSNEIEKQDLCRLIDKLSI